MHRGVLSVFLALMLSFGVEGYAQTQAQEQAREKARQEAPERAREQAREKARQEAQEHAREAARERAREEARDRARQEAQERAREAARERAREEARDRARQEAQERAREQAREQAKQQAQEKEREKAKQQAQEQAREKARQEAQEQAREKAKQQAQEQAREKARQEAQEKEREKAKQQAQEKEREKAKQQAQEQAREKAKQQAQEKEREKAKQEAQEQAREKAKQQAQEKEREKAKQQARAQRDSQEKAKRESQAQTQRDAEKKSRLEAKVKELQKDLAEKQAQEDAQKKSQLQAQKAEELQKAKAKLEALQKELAQRQASQKDADQKSQIEAQSMPRKKDAATKNAAADTVSTSTSAGLSANQLKTMQLDQLAALPPEQRENLPADRKASLDRYIQAKKGLEQSQWTRSDSVKAFATALKEGYLGVGTGVTRSFANTGEALLHPKELLDDALAGMAAVADDPVGVGAATARAAKNSYDQLTEAVKRGDSKAAGEITGKFFGDVVQGAGGEAAIAKLAGSAKTVASRLRTEKVHSIDVHSPSNDLVGRAEPGKSAGTSISRQTGRILMDQGRGNPTCGPVACAMIIHTVTGKTVDVKKLLTHVTLTSDGISMGEAAELLRINGVPGVRYDTNVNLDQLAQLTRDGKPAIVKLWKNQGLRQGRHAVVVDEVIGPKGGRLVRIRDPQGGVEYLQPEHVFSQEYVGEVISIQ